MAGGFAGTVPNSITKFTTDNSEQSAWLCGQFVSHSAAGRITAFFAEMHPCCTLGVPCPDPGNHYLISRAVCLVLRGSLRQHWRMSIEKPLPGGRGDGDGVFA